MNEKLFEYRIKYNAGPGHSEMNSYHYYMALNASQAFLFHIKAVQHKKTCVQNISIEKYNPYSQKWEDRSEVIFENESDYYS